MMFLSLRRVQPVVCAHLTIGHEHPFAIQNFHNRHQVDYLGDGKPVQLQFLIKRKNISTFYTSRSVYLYHMALMHHGVLILLLHCRSPIEKGKEWFHQVEKQATTS